MTIDSEIYNYVVSEETHPDKSVIIKEGGHSNWVYLLLEGKVKVKKRTPKGFLTIDTLKEGDIFGEMILLRTDKVGRTASFIADGPVLLGLLDTIRITDDLNSLSPQLRKFISTLATRLQDATDKVVGMALK